MKPIFLIGYMGSGKTTLGKALAKEMKCTFIDLDNYIENRFRQTIKQMFATHGEAYFRDVERRMLAEVAEFNDVIVACGGGTPCQEGNMELMNSRGITVWLYTSIERLMARLTLPGAKRKRPLIADKTDEEILTFITAALEARRVHYEKAQIAFDSTDIETGAATILTARRLAQLLAETEVE